MKFVRPQIYLLARKTLDLYEVDSWLEELGVFEYQIPEGTDAEKLMVLSGKRSYMSFEPGINPNVSKVRIDINDFIENILSSKHGSLLEHSSFTFAFENVSRVFTAEMNRHRAGWAITEGSMRFIRFTDIPFWFPDSIQDDMEDSSDIREAKIQSREVFKKAFLQMEENYKALEKIWSIDQLKAFKEKKKITSMMRRIIGMGVATGGLWTGNLRAIRHVITLRVDPAAEEEMILVFSEVLKMMIDHEPLIFADFENADGYWTPKHWKV